MGSITKTKTGYRAIVRLGKHRNKPIQKCFNNHKDAKLFIRKQEALIINGKCAIRKYPTLEEALERYLASVSSKKKTYYYEQKIISKFIRELPFIHNPLNLITTADISEYRDSYLQSHKVSTWIRNLNIIKHLWKVAQLEWGYELKNIFYFARKLSKPQPRFRRLNEDDDDPSINLTNILMNRITSSNAMSR